MTDFQNWWEGYFHEINGQKETAQAAWQARGELDAVRIEGLEAINKQLEFRLDAWYESSKNAVQRVNELTAKLDTAREALIVANGRFGFDCPIEVIKDFPTPLYTAPPSREWVGLSDEEIIEKCAPIWGAIINTRDREETVDFARAIEAKLREKNNG